MKLEPGEHWSEHAVCREVDPELFFPDKGETSAKAKSICRECPVQQECLDYALSIPGWRAVQGVWGGTTEKERARIRRPSNVVARDRDYLTTTITRLAHRGMTAKAISTQTGIGERTVYRYMKDLKGDQ